MKTQNQLLALASIGQLVGCISLQAAEHKSSRSSDRPNILFCIADDASYHHFGANGCPWVSTPNFDRVAEDGILYENCYTPNAKSAPSRAVVLTGRYSWQLGEGGNHITNFPADVKVFTEVLKESGYDVAYTGKTWAPGNPGIVDGKPRQLTGRPFQSKKTVPPTKGINKCDYAGNFKDFLDNNNGDKPWVFWFGSTEPHRKYEYGTGVKLGHRSTEEIDEVPAFWPDNQTVRNDLLDYGYEIEYYDNQIGMMLDELEKRGELNNTLIIITSDNGMPFPRCKANDYEYSNHMPLAMMWADGIKNPGRKVSSYVSFIDLAPTILDVAGAQIKDNGMKEITGHSLMSALKDNMTKKELKQRQTLFLGRERDDYGRPDNQGYPIRAILQDNYLYIWNVKPGLMPAGNPETGYLDVDGSPTKTTILNLKRDDIDTRLWELSFGFRPEEELYDLGSDPYCMINLAGNSNFKEIQESLSKQLKAELIRTNDPRMGDSGDIFDHYRFDSEDKWNFFERVTSGELKEPWNQTRWVNPDDYEYYHEHFNSK